MAKDEPDYLEWLVKKRSECQHSCLNLLRLLQENREKLKPRNRSLAAQALVGAAFSLWRAVFLADKENKLGVSLNHSMKFLDKIVRTNAIAFSQEMDSNEWSFNYYVNNARYRLCDPLTELPNFMTPWKSKLRSARERWEYNHKKFNEVLKKFSKTLESDMSSSWPSPQKKPK